MPQPRIDETRWQHRTGRSSSAAVATSAGLAGAALAVALAACGSSATSSPPTSVTTPVSHRQVLRRHHHRTRPTHRSVRSSTTTMVTTPTTASAVAGRGLLTLITEPGDGMAPIYRILTAARHTLEMTMYELSDPTVEQDLAADAARGVDVRVILDQNRERPHNQAAYGYLASHGVHVHWADPTYDATHQKTITIDGATSVIMSLNLVPADYPTTRDFAVVDTEPADVNAVVATFDADDVDAAVTPPTGTDLVWSPTNAEDRILSVIGGAHHTLAVENEEMDDPEVTAALATAARRGVDVDVTMTEDSEWDSALAQLRTAGVHVALYPDSDRVLYIHAKAVVADAASSDRRAFVGSENFSVASLLYNRELGIDTTAQAVVSGLAAVLGADFAGTGR